MNPLVHISPKRGPASQTEEVNQLGAHQKQVAEELLKPRSVWLLLTFKE